MYEMYFEDDEKIEQRKKKEQLTKNFNKLVQNSLAYIKDYRMWHHLVKRECASCSKVILTRYHGDPRDARPEIEEEALKRYSERGNFCIPCNSKFEPEVPKDEPEK